MIFYLVGIKGVGMCSLSSVLVELGHKVIGCDFNNDFFTTNLIKEEVIIEEINNITINNEYTYIIGNAFKNSEYVKTIKNTCEYYDYPYFIEKFFRMAKISISGTHGKTTTTSFISQLSNKNINILCGDGYGRANREAQYLVLEACEYKNHFLEYTNKILLINNIELDHPDYFKNIEDVIKSFQKAAVNSQIVIVNGDDENCKKIKHYNLITFGMNDYNDIKFNYNKNVVTIAFYGNSYIFDIELGLHNIYNFVASFIICKLIDSDDDYIKNNIINLKLPKRRLEKYIINNTIIYDDYAHHPTEISSTLSYLKNYYNDKKIIVLFQPHTYSRTKVLLNEFIKSLSIADEVYILDVFSSIREQGEGNLLLEQTNFTKYNNDLLKSINNKNVYIFMGAGDINKLINKVNLIEN